MGTVLKKITDTNAGTEAGFGFWRSYGNHLIILKILPFNHAGSADFDQYPAKELEKKLSFP